MEAGQIEYIGEEKARDAEVWSDSARVEGFKSRRVGESEGAAVTGIVLADKLAGMFHFGKSWYTPGSFRKSGKQRSYGIRNLEECVSRRKERTKKVAFRRCVLRTIPRMEIVGRHPGNFVKECGTAWL